MLLVTGSGYWFWRTRGLLVIDSRLVLVTDYMILARAGLGDGEDAGEGPGHKKGGGRGAQARQRPPVDCDLWRGLGNAVKPKRLGILENDSASEPTSERSG